MQFVAKLTDPDFLALQIGALQEPRKIDLEGFEPKIDTQDFEVFSKWFSQLRSIEEGINAQTLDYSDAAIAAKMAARDGNWQLFCEAVGSMKEPPVTLIGLLNECFGYFIESGNITNSKILADKLIGYSGKGERERKIFEKEGTDLDRITMILNRSDLSGDDFRHLGEVAVSCADIRDDFIKAVIRDSNKSSVCWTAPQGIRALLKENLNDTERFPIALELFKRTTLSLGLLKSAIEEGIKYNRVSFNQDNLKLAYKSLEHFTPDSKKEEFEWCLFRVRAAHFLKKPYDQFLERAKELADECAWAHSRYISTTRASALKEVDSLVTELKL